MKPKAANYIELLPKLNKKFLIVFIPVVLLSCGNGNEKKSVVKDTLPPKDTLPEIKPGPVVTKNTPVACTNDSLDELANVIAGIDKPGAKILNDIFQNKNFKEFSSHFNKKWNEFDTSRLIRLEQFRANDLGAAVGETKTLFYPFSGPDFLYANAFFPEADKYILMGLEPVGTRPIYDQTAEAKDSLTKYYSKINSSLFTILNFSFFRTAGMRKDLHNQELNGTLHLLLLFIKRTGHDICSLKPVYIDSTGMVQQINSFTALAKKVINNHGVEITFTTKNGKQKKLYYFSLHLEDAALKNNKGVNKFFDGMGDVNTYLKGASYLMHESYFSQIRNTIFAHSNNIIQDDSGIALRFFDNSGYQWSYTFYGKYLRPISLFKYAFQKDLDSLYKMKGSKEIGFGIGYNFRDKNSNLMVAKRGEKIPGFIAKEINKPKAEKVQIDSTKKKSKAKSKV